MRPRILLILAAAFSAIALSISVFSINCSRAQDAGPSLFSDEPAAKPVDAARPPLSLAQNTEPPPLPQADDAVAPAGAEALTQGPVHEAFAKPMELNPEPVPLIKKRPPDPIQEIPPAQQPDGNNIVWIPGYWAWDDGRENFLWVSGVYRAAPPYQTWVPGYWDEVEGGYQWTPGFWASTAKADVDYLPQPPESQEHGPASPQPSDNHFWVPGNWVYQNVNVVQPYAWRPGYWAACQPDWIFVPAHYVWTPGGYVFVDGYWDYTLSRRGCLFAPLYFNQPVYLQAGYAYTPSILINVGGFNDCLFCRPAYCSYYFGDYFGPRYVGLGFRPWCSVGIGVGFGFDPLFTYYRWNNTRRNPNWLANTRQHFELASRNDALRPPRTFLAQQQLLKANGGKPGNNNFLMASTLKQAAADPAQAGLGSTKFHNISQSDRMALADKGKELQQVSTQRLDLEKKNVNVGGGKLGGGKFDKGSDGAVTGSPKFNGTGPALGGANNGTGGDDDGKNNSKLGKLKLPTAAASNLKVATGGAGNAAGSQGGAAGSQGTGSQGDMGSGRQGKYLGSQGLGSSAGSGALGSGAAGSGAMSGNTGSSGRSGRGALGSGIGGNTMNPGNKNNSAGTGAAGGGTNFGGSKQALGGSGGASGAAGGIGSGAAGGTSSGGSQPRIFSNPSGGSTGSSGPIGNPFGSGSGQGASGNPSGAGRGSSGFGAGGFGAGGAGAGAGGAGAGGAGAGGAGSGGAGSGGAGSGSGRGSGGGGNQPKQKDNDDSKKKSDITPPRSNMALTPPNAGPMDAAGVLKADRQARNTSTENGMNEVSRQMKSAQTIDLDTNSKDGAAAGTSGTGSNIRGSRGLAGLGSSGSADGGNRNPATANPNSGNPQASDLRTFNQSQAPKSPYLPRYDYQTLMDRGRTLSGGVAGSGVGTASGGGDGITTSRPKDPMVNFGGASGQSRSSSYRSAGSPGPSGPSMYGPTGQSMSGISAPGVSGINAQMTSGMTGQMSSGISAPMMSGISGTMSSGISAPMASGISAPMTSGMSGLTNSGGPRASGSYVAPGGFQGTAGSLTGGQPMLDPGGRSYNPSGGSPGSYIPAR